MVSFPGCLQSDRTMTFRPRFFHALLAVGFGLAQAPAPLLAQQGSFPGWRLTPEQRQQLFPQQKQLWLQHSRARISAQQRAESCVQSAQNSEAFMTCLQSARQNNMSLRRSNWAEMRALLGRYGIQLPEQPGRRGGPAGGPGGPAGADI